MLYAAPVETVNNTNDAGAGSLRQAITDVNLEGEIVFDIPGPGPNTIVVSAPLEIDKSMTISGPGENLLTIMSGVGIDQVIVVSNSNPTQSRVVISDLTVHGQMSNLSGIGNEEFLTLNNITITGAGVGIFNSGQFNESAVLTINNSKLTGNLFGVFVSGEVGAGLAGGHVTINDSIINNNDIIGISIEGAVGEFAQGSKVVVNNTTISGNSAGIFNSGGKATGATGGIVEVNNSSITENVASDSTEGDGIINGGGNAEGATGGTVVVKNSTISKNAGAGILALGGGVAGSTGPLTQISSSTLSENEFALIMFPVPGEPDGIPVVEVKNSIFANSTSSNCILNGLMLSSMGVNISTNDSCPGFVEVTSDELDLRPLQDNGGPTETQALSARSAAVDLVTDCTFINGEPVLTDQRGFLRPQFNCDVGAFELGAIPTGPQIVPTLSALGTIITTVLFGLIVVFYLRKRKIV